MYFRLTMVLTIVTFHMERQEIGTKDRINDQKYDRDRKAKNIWQNR